MTINNKIRKRSIYVKILLLIILSILAVSLLMFGNTFYTPKEIFTEPSFAKVLAVNSIDLPASISPSLLSMVFVMLRFACSSV